MILLPARAVNRFLFWFASTWAAFASASGVNVSRKTGADACSFSSSSLMHLLALNVAFALARISSAGMNSDSFSHAF
jgi:hypothetical protein